MSSVKNYFDQADTTGDNILNISGTWKVNGTSITSTAAEINLNDLSAQTEELLAAGALSPSIRVSYLSLVGAGAVTLAAPSASMVGVTKVIEMVTDNGDVTLALTNVQGGTAATTCTFSAVGQQLVLVGGRSKWTVTGQGGVVLS